MENNIFDKWNSNIDLKGLQEDVKKAQEDNREYETIPHGEYEVKLDKLELKATKKGDPMVSIWFKIVSDCEYKGSLIFMNQVVTKGFQIHIVNDFLRTLECGVDIDFESYKQYNELLLDVFEAVNGNFEYGLKYGKTEKGFNTFEITEVFELD